MKVDDCLCCCCCLLLAARLVYNLFFKVRRVSFRRFVFQLLPLLLLLVVRRCRIYNLPDRSHLISYVYLVHRSLGLLPVLCSWPALIGSNRVPLAIRSRGSQLRLHFGLYSADRGARSRRAPSAVADGWGAESEPEDWIGLDFNSEVALIAFVVVVVCCRSCSWIFLLDTTDRRCPASVGEE